MSLKKYFYLLLALAVSYSLVGCTTMNTKGNEFPKMYVEQPQSLLILPPINQSTAADAKDYYSTTTEIPFALMGYYVFPNELTAELLKQEGIYDTELLYNQPLNKFKDYFGADAVLLTTIKKWDVSYVVLASKLTVSIDSEIKSTTTSETLWKYNGTVVVDLGNNNSGGGVAGLLVAIVATAISTAMVDYTKYAQVANNRIITSLPYGVYHPMHMKDQTMEFVKQ